MAITGMAAADTDATRTLIADMPDWIDRRRRMSDGYCTGRDDLPKVYGLMHSLPVDMGASCGEFEKVFELRSGCARGGHRHAGRTAVLFARADMSAGDGQCEAASR